MGGMVHLHHTKVLQPNKTCSSPQIQSQENSCSEVFSAGAHPVLTDCLGNLSATTSIQPTKPEVYSSYTLRDFSTRIKHSFDSWFQECPPVLEQQRTSKDSLCSPVLKVGQKSMLSSSPVLVKWQSSWAKFSSKVQIWKCTWHETFLSKDLISSQSSCIYPKRGKYSPDWGNAGALWPHQNHAVLCHATALKLLPSLLLAGKRTDAELLLHTQTPIRLHCTSRQPFPDVPWELESH